MDKVLGFSEFKDVDFYRALLAEFLGTGFLVLVGCGSVTGSSTTTVEIAFAFGLTVGIMVYAIGHLSGGHINPAVTVGMLVAGNVSIIRAILYIVFQLAGAIVGAAILYGVISKDDREKGLGYTSVSGITEGQGVCIEVLITFVLVFTVFAVVDPRRPELKAVAPMVIGLSVATCHLWAIKFTGSSMNTARTFGPAIVGNVWTNHWIYWVGPLAGGLIAGILYKFIFSARKKGKTGREEGDPEMERPEGERPEV